VTAGDSPAIQPSLERVRELAADYNLVAVYRHDLADTQTPVAAYWLLNQDGPGFLLESVEGGERLGRYSFIGGEPRVSITMGGGEASIAGAGAVHSLPCTDPVALLEEFLGDCRQAPDPDLAGRFSGGLVGYLAYESARYFEKLPESRSDPVGVPDGVFFLTDNVVVFDHLLHRRTIIAHVRIEPGVDIDKAYEAAVARVNGMAARLEGEAPPPGPDYPHEPVPAEDAEGEWNIGPDDFKARVERCKEYILAGDIFQVQVSRRLRAPNAAHPFYLYRVLRTVNPSPYMYYLRLPGHAGDRQRGTAAEGDGAC